ncbi:MAG: hypothetical protein K6G79_01720 [Bacteroidales bacterium]|nr:hypothetical protein [Bacteroidales bacterium]
MKEKRFYVSPQSEAIVLEMNGIVCESYPEGTQNENYGLSGNAYNDSYFD